MKKLITICAVAMMILVSNVQSQADTLSAIDGGWYKISADQTTASHTAGNYNYYAGTTSGTENRNFFVFDLSSVTITVKQATLRLYNPSGTINPGDIETYTVFDVSTPISELRAGGSGIPQLAIFNDLGSGIQFGAQNITDHDFGSYVEVSLNQSCIAALNSATGLYAIGGAITTLEPRWVEGAFGSSNALSGASLILSPVPEPATIAFLGLGALSLIRRKSNNN